MKKINMELVEKDLTKNSQGYIIGDGNVTEAYKKAYKEFTGTVEEFYNQIDNDEHRMYMKWVELADYIKNVRK